MIDGDRRRNLLARIANVGADAPILDRICQGAVALLDISGAAVILMSEGDSGVLTAAFGARVAEVEDLQFTLGEGPCLEAFRAGAPIFEPNLRDGSRGHWPQFSAQALAFGARAVFVLPLQLGAIRVGVLYLYRDRPGMLGREELADGLDLADLAILSVLELQGQAARGELGAGLEGEWSDRAAVHQATGMVSAQLSLKLADALARIRAYAFAEERTLYDVAAEIVSGLLRLDP